MQHPLLTLGFSLVARVLPTPDGVFAALLWAPPATAALLVLAALREVLRATR